MSDTCPKCGSTHVHHVLDGWNCLYSQLTAAHARIAELEVAVLEIKHECPWMGKWVTERRKYATLRDGMKALAEQLEQIVCVVPPDDGVVLLSNEGPVHYDAEQQCNVYDHEHFSPLGDALIAMHDKLTALAGEKGE